MNGTKTCGLQIHPDQPFHQATDPTANPPVSSPALLAGNATEVAASTGVQDGGVGFKRKSSV